MANWYHYFRSPSRGIHRLANLSYGGNESAENFRRVVGQFVHGNRGYTSQTLQPSAYGNESLPLLNMAI
jgi:hypothetical protein